LKIEDWIFKELAALRHLIISGYIERENTRNVAAVFNREIK